MKSFFYRSSSWVAITIVSLAFGIACGPVDTKSNDSPRAKRTEQSTELINWYDDLQDTTCLSSNAVGNLSSLLSYEQTGSELNKVSFSLPQGTSIPTLSSSSISETNFGIHRQKQCTYENNELECDSRSTIIAQPRPVVICDKTKNFDRYSPEQAALSTIAGIESARAAYLDTTNHDPALPKTALMIFPKIEKKVAKSATKNSQAQIVSIFDSDNLAYSPNYSGKPTFIVFPKGKLLEERGLWKNIALWESRWVVAHEFGHHVFRYHAEYGLTRTSAHGYRPSHFEDSNNPPGTSLALAGGDLTSRTISAINEGFADLYANTVIPAQEKPLQALDCFRNSRDVLNARYGDGTDKKLTSKVYKIFIGESQQSTRSSQGCSSPRFTDAHAIGAIFAHGVYQNFPNTNTQEGANELRAVLVDFADSVKSLASADPANNAQFLADFLGKFIDAAKKRNANAARQLCSDFRERFEGLGASLAARLDSSCTY